METLTKNHISKDIFLEKRHRTEAICRSLKSEDTSVQPADFVSPPKWHLAHTTWFFEQFVLGEHKENYIVFDKDFAYYFNSYYNNVGDRVIRANRGLMTRPTFDQVLKYRAYVNNNMAQFLEEELSQSIYDIVEIGLQHEQQHQELLIYDIKYIFGHQPSFPKLDFEIKLRPENAKQEFVKIDEGLYKIGHQDDCFCWDNELGEHKVYLYDFEISNRLVTNEEYIEFIEDGGYNDFNLWHADGWDYCQKHQLSKPLYWHKSNNKWMHYTLQGFKEVIGLEPVNHITFYEAFAFAQWKGMRLPTEFEWEVASKELNYGQLWEWTNSAYLPYPNYKKAEGAIGEYNGKFMINTMVMRGASAATPKDHCRPTYRNFFTPETRWQFSGIRLVK
ncbi:ergothioneine biosynthesis protein EgtB [Winogradskyella sp. PE311]|uniref:ergothioneine biosynthesis protein EgtB n=1 Tax=Winogradskyella sp. PE311 TaxID=3366943 RepID=UPI003980DE3F